MIELRKRHFFLASAFALFQDIQDGTGVGPVHSVPMNVVVPSEQQIVTARDLGVAQQNVQVQLHKRMGENQVEVVDVVFNSISYLGHMTDEEFYGQGVQKAGGTEAAANAG
jgi:hypothetical protein